VPPFGLFEHEGGDRVFRNVYIYLPVHTV